MPKKQFNSRFDKNSWYRRNEQIRLSPVRVVDDDGSQLGVIPTEKALYIARGKGLDLIEVAPNVRPPVCKIMEWSKFKYELSKKQKGQKKRDKMKEMQFKALIGKGDLDHKMKKVLEFLEKGHTVKLTVRTPKRVEIQRSEELMCDIMLLVKGKMDVALIQAPKRESFYVNAVVKAESKKSKKSNGKNEDKQNSKEEISVDENGKSGLSGNGMESPSKQKKQETSPKKKSS